MFNNPPQYKRLLRQKCLTFKYNKQKIIIAYYPSQFTNNIEKIIGYLDEVKDEIININNQYINYNNIIGISDLL